MEGDIRPDPIRRVLEALHDLRDVAELGDGYWLPAPERFVELPSGVVLVVGGGGTAQVDWGIRALITHTWLARLLDKERLPATMVNEPTLWQPYENWLGRWKTSDLAQWTEQLLAHARGHVLRSGSDVTGFDLYLPRRGSRESQYLRWIPVRELADQPPDLVLCRSVATRFGPATYWLGEVRKSKGVSYLAREYPVALQHLRRLQYGLDLLAHAPTYFTLEQRATDQLITLRSWLPPEERRLLLALARDESERPGRLPSRYSFAPENAKDILRALSDLGIEMRAAH
jgi:hypothetical protein